MLKPNQMFRQVQMMSPSATEVILQTKNNVFDRANKESLLNQ